MIDLASMVGSMAQSGIGSGFARAGADMGAGGIGAGEMVTGAMGGQGPAYVRGASAGLDLMKKRMEARKLRDEAIARDRTYQTMSAAFPNMDSSMVDLMANTMLGGMGSDFSSTMTGAKTAQQMDLQRRAAEASDPAARNQILAAMHGQPQDLTSISGGVAYNPTVAPGEQAMVQTPASVADDIRQTMAVGARVSGGQGRRDETARNMGFTDAGDREARAMAGREARRIADERRLEGFKISAAQERDLAEKMIRGEDWELYDESGANFRNVRGSDGRTMAARKRGGPAAATTGMSTPVQTDGQVAAPKSKAEYDALPSGARYTAPDGSVRVKR